MHITNSYSNIGLRSGFFFLLPWPPMAMGSHLLVLDILAFVGKAILFADLKFCLW
jgi:hypothetical protein